MTTPFLLHDLVFASAARRPQAPALVAGRNTLDYGELASRVQTFAAGLCKLGLARGDRVGIWLDKRFETVVAAFGAAAAGCVFVPLNPLLKPSQVGYILRDCNVRLLVTSAERLALVADELARCADCQHVACTGDAAGTSLPGLALHAFAGIAGGAATRTHRVIDSDMLAILYTSGSTGAPKGVVLSHRNMVAGATSVASYLGNDEQDTILAALPLSFDAGFSQLTTAFHAGARVVLINYLLPKDVLNAVQKERVTGLTAVPPLWIQLSQLDWAPQITDHLRYIANTGGRMPEETLKILRAKLPNTRPFLMYGLTEAFRSTFLPPEEVDRRPDSIGKAIPNAEILVLREDGTPCAPDEPGELVHRGALVGMGYWNDPVKTAERYKPLPGRVSGLVLPELAVFSGDTVRKDAEGFLYFVGRRDEMIKTSGYRVSPTEIEEILYGAQDVAECAAFGVAHPVLGHAIVVVAAARPGRAIDEASLIAHCRERLPMYMVPARIHARDGALPRNPNGKIDRKAVAAEYATDAP
ncbi:MAG TPA: acyl-CoA ligase (AMP-forming), exosortase A system-associated [Casimicrobiaceae bacterium]|jgi:acyl-CoA ligase (AMP-forming) (exosortase A-associated)|nr:acyl-CoA ligase (AMP-forming), exosortase A system-associated [Casimicrobiaceae bacterium]